jgi:hypothetical protein
MYDRWRVQRAQVKEAVPAHPWEAKGGLLYHIDLGLDLVIRVCCPVETCTPQGEHAVSLLCQQSHFSNSVLGSPPTLL